MSRIEMKHPSYPGYHGTYALGRCAGEARPGCRVMIPTAAAFPRAAALVSRFVAERVDGVGRDVLEQLLAPIDDTSASGLTSWLQRLEAQDATGFTALRNWVYYGYYTSGSVAEALRHTSSDFHGAPQPFGYQIDHEAPLPQAPRGSYQTTEEVRRVID